MHLCKTTKTQSGARSNVTTVTSPVTVCTESAVGGEARRTSEGRLWSQRLIPIHQKRSSPGTSVLCGGRERQFEPRRPNQKHLLRERPGVGKPEEEGRCRRVDPGTVRAVSSRDCDRACRSLHESTLRNKASRLRTRIVMKVYPWAAKEIGRRSASVRPHSSVYSRQSRSPRSDSSSPSRHGYWPREDEMTDARTSGIDKASFGTLTLDEGCIRHAAKIGPQWSTTASRTSEFATLCITRGPRPMFRSISDGDLSCHGLRGILRRPLGTTKERG